MILYLYTIIYGGGFADGFTTVNAHTGSRITNGFATDSREFARVRESSQVRESSREFARVRESSRRMRGRIHNGYTGIRRIVAD